MKKRIYIINVQSVAAAYGIGTYIDQLIESLKYINIDWGIINLLSDQKEITITNKGSYDQIDIPKVAYPPKKVHYYLRNVAYLLKNILPDESNTQYIFHLNYIEGHELAFNIKKLFNCKIFLVAHYTEWSFRLFGDYEKLKIILKKSENELDNLEKTILKYVNSDKEMINNCDKIICVAKHSLHYFIDICKYDISRCIVINNAIKDMYSAKSIIQKKYIKKKLFIPDNYKIVVFAGRLVSVKGVSFLIKAFKKILETNPNTLLYIAGDGNQFNQFLSETKDFWGRILFTGRLDKKRLYKLYSISDIGVVSSIHEEFGLVALEMMMHKLPVIATNTGGLGEIIEDNVSGFKIPIRNIKGKRCVDTTKMIDKIDLLLNNPELAAEIAKNGRRRFLEKYELSIFKKLMIDFYLNL